MARFLLLAALAVVAAVAAAVEVKTATINALGVLKDCGVVTPIEVALYTPGNGSVYVEGVSEAARGFRPSAELAYLYAARLAGVPPGRYDVYITVYTNESKISGPSASAYLAAAIYAALMGYVLRNDTAMTGILLPTGLVGPVGGVTFKTSAAWRSGLRQVVLPIGGFLGAAHIRGRIAIAEVGTVEEALWHLAGVKISRPKSLDLANYTQATRRLYETYSERLGGRAGADVEAAVGSRYYVAFTLLFEEASSSTSTADPEGVFKAVEREILGVDATAANVDILAATFMKLYEDYLERPGRMEARAYVARLWLDVARQHGGGRRVDRERLREVAEFYMRYADATFRYLSEIYLGDLSYLEARLEAARRYLGEGGYVQSLALSLYSTAYATALLVGPPSVRLVDEARRRALTHAAEAAACGSQAIIPLSYIELGDYYKSSLDKLQQAFFYYTLSSLYSMAVVDITCGAPPPAAPEVEESRLDLFALAVAAAAAVMAAAYVPAAVGRRGGSEV